MKTTSSTLAKLLVGAQLALSATCTGIVDPGSAEPKGRSLHCGSIKVAVFDAVADWDSQMMADLRKNNITAALFPGVPSTRHHVKDSDYEIDKTALIQRSWKGDTISCAAVRDHPFLTLDLSESVRSASGVCKDVKHPYVDFFLAKAPHVREGCEGHFSVKPVTNRVIGGKPATVYIASMHCGFWQTRKRWITGVLLALILHVGVAVGGYQFYYCRKTIRR